MAGPASPTILVIDDDADVRALAASALNSEGFVVREVGSGMEAFAVLAEKPPDLVVLDIVMPGVSGLEVLDHIRTHHPSLPVIFLSSLGADENIIRGLRLGAEDYVVKPFSPRVLVARVQTALRRKGGSLDPTTTIVHGALRVDTQAREVWVGDDQVELTAKEFDLLSFLAANPGRVYTRRQLLVEVWQSDSAWQQEATVTEHVSRIRNKIESRPGGLQWVSTVRGVGYRFDRRDDGKDDSGADVG